MCLSSSGIKYLFMSKRSCHILSLCKKDKIIKIGFRIKGRHLMKAKNHRDSSTTNARNPWEFLAYIWCLLLIVKAILIYIFFLKWQNLIGPLDISNQTPRSLTYGKKKDVFLIPLLKVTKHLPLVPGNIIVGGLISSTIVTSRSCVRMSSVLVVFCSPTWWCGMFRVVTRWAVPLLGQGQLNSQLQNIVFYVW